MTEDENLTTSSAGRIEPEFLTKSEAAQLLGISVRSVDNLMRKRRISFVKLTPRMVRFPRREILRDVRERMTIHAHGHTGGVL